MASAEVDTPKETLEEKLSGLNLENPETPPEEVPEKFEDSKDTEVEETPELPESLLEDIKCGTPKLHHVETVDTTDPVTDEDSSSVVKAEVPEVFQEELKADHDIVPPAPDVTVVETVATEVGADGGETAPVTREVPVEVVHEETDTKPTSTLSAIGGKISQQIHKIIG